MFPLRFLAKVKEHFETHLMRQECTLYDHDTETLYIRILKPVTPGRKVRLSVWPQEGTTNFYSCIIFDLITQRIE